MHGSGSTFQERVPRDFHPGATAIAPAFLPVFAAAYPPALTLVWGAIFIVAILFLWGAARAYNDSEEHEHARRMRGSLRRIAKPADRRDR